MNFEYYYGTQADQFSFIRIPSHRKNSKMPPATASKANRSHCLYQSNVPISIKPRIRLIRPFPMQYISTAIFTSTLMYHKALNIYNVRQSKASLFLFNQSDFLQFCEIIHCFFLRESQITLYLRDLIDNVHLVFFIKPFIFH